MRAKEIFGLHHIGIYVTDIQESIKFYEEVLDFHFDYGFEDPGPQGLIKIALMRKDNFSVELLELADSSQVKSQAEHTFNHFTMYVNDINKTVERLKKDGRVVFEPGGIVEDFGKEHIQFIFFRAINGERIELVQASLG